MKPKLILFLLTIIICSVPAFSQNVFSWTGDGTNNDWGNSQNWMDQGGFTGVPSSIDSVIFNTGDVIDIENVPNTFSLAGIKILTVSGTGAGTTVNFVFTADLGKVNLGDLFILEDCSLNFDEDQTIWVGNQTYFNQGSLGIPLASIYFAEEANIEFGATFFADSVVSQNTMNLNQQAGLVLNCVFENQGIFNINDGNVIVHNKFHSTQSMYGGPESYFELASDAIHCDPLQVDQLGTLVNNSGVPLQLGGDLIVENVLDLPASDLQIKNYLLTINGDCQFGTGALEGETSSKLRINSGAYANTNGIDTIYLYFTGETGTLHTFILEKTNGLVHFTDNMIITDSLILNSGKIRFKHNSLELFENSTLTYSKDNYVITDTSSYIVANISAAPGIFTFPVGTNTYYAPVTITPAAASSFNVSVTDHVFSHGGYGYRLAPNEIVDLTWNIEADDITTNFAVDFNWDPSAQGPGFLSADAFIAHFETDRWVISGNYLDATASSAETGFNAQSLTDDLNYGYFAVSSQDNVAPVASNFETTISEDIESETIVGTLEISDQNTDQTLLIFPAPHNYGPAFYFEHSGNIYVDSSELLHYPTIPVYNYNIRVCDNGLPILCTQILATIYLERGERDFFVTNYISPNNDGYNDYWIIMEADRINFETFVYNSSGDIVYRSDNYRNDWDGTSNGQKLAPGVYFYFIRSLYGDQRGTLTLAR